MKPFDPASVIPLFWIARLPDPLHYIIYYIHIAERAHRTDLSVLITHILVVTIP